jgi:hypothetical protein
MNAIMNAKVFGDGHARCRFTNLAIEVGSGALSVDEQAISNLGKLEYNLAELKQRRKDHFDRQAGEIAHHNTMLGNHGAIAADDIAARQSSVYTLAAQDIAIQNLQRQSAALAAEHDALVEQIGVVRLQLRQEGILQKYGEWAASAWRARIHDRGWSLPT